AATWGVRLTGESMGLLRRIDTGGSTAASVRRGSPNVVQYGPNTRQNGGAGVTRDQHEPTRCPTPLNLQNLHPRFKSGRRLHFSCAISIVCVRRAQAKASELSRIVSNAVACRVQPRANQ